MSTITGQTMTPQRIQRKRTKGWKMPANAVYVGRPSRWGNPYPVTAMRSSADAIGLFDQYARTRSIEDREWLAPLRSKDLACWCPLDRPCHADILLRLANA
jgi:hypothetical protein